MQFEAKRQSKNAFISLYLPWSCNLPLLLCLFVCFFVKSILFSNIACKGFICIVFKYWKQVYFRFRSIRARPPFDRRSELMSNQYADVRFVVSLGSSRNSTSHKERWELCSALYHCKKHMLEWLCVPHWPWSAIILFGNIANALNNVGKSFFMIWQSCTHSWETLQMRYGSLRNVVMHFKPLKCVERCIINVWGYSNIHIRMWHM